MPSARRLARDVGASLVVVLRDMQVVRCHTIADVDHVQLRILGVIAVRIVLQQQAEVVEGLLEVLDVALVRIRAEQARIVAGIVRQAAHVIHIVDMRIARMLLDEAVGGVDGLIVVVRVVVRGDRLQLRLRRVFRKREPRAHLRVQWQRLGGLPVHEKITRRLVDSLRVRRFELVPLSVGQWFLAVTGFVDPLVGGAAGHHQGDDHAQRENDFSHASPEARDAARF